MSQVERAVSCFREGFNCSQAVFSTYGPQLGLDRELALKVTGPFGAGMARMGQVCGAVTGSFMVIGLIRGRTRAEDEETREKAYRLVHEFVDQFTARNGSILCRELLGCDLSTEEGQALAEERNLFDTLCPKFIQDAAEIMEQFLE